MSVVLDLRYITDTKIWTLQQYLDLYVMKTFGRIRDLRYKSGRFLVVFMTWCHKPLLEWLPNFQLNLNNVTQ